ncbi:hypothetical protein [Lyngbya confervoides]|uniref:Uncharacterized protein n=1 Tax=Lyngbya confervoides BDU141951 TaxID=1574623 RepID=A0ABD4T5X8_9CYAN|nr:hypothetical protein [Lyngbya confervoides]MCM1984186.1 hypothetical protein [Lyngbya confervoides BDU141951]
MDRDLVFKELAIVLAVESQESRAITPDFLAQSGISRKGWELATKPLLSDRGALIRYKNGFAIASSPKQFQIVQPFDGTPVNVLAPKMALRYCEILSGVDYRAVGVNFRSFLSFSGQEEAARQYILGLLNSNRLSTKPYQASLNLSYAFERNTLNLTIQDAVVTEPDGTAVPGIVFTGNCETRFQPESGQPPIDLLHQALNAWETDFAKYTTLVTEIIRNP